MSYDKVIKKEALKLYISGKSEKEIANILYEKCPEGSQLSERLVRIWISWYKLVREVQEETKTEIQTPKSKQLEQHFEDLIDIAQALLPEGSVAKVFLPEYVIEIKKQLLNLECTINPLLIDCFFQHLANELNLKESKNYYKFIEKKPKLIIRALRSICARKTVKGVCEVCSNLG